MSKKQNIERPPVKMSSLELVTHAMSWLAGRPENKGFTFKQLTVLALPLSVRMVQSGLFVLTDNEGAKIV